LSITTIKPGLNERQIFGYESERMLLESQLSREKADPMPLVQIAEKSGRQMPMPSY
jgi:hypothetical protein